MLLLSGSFGFVRQGIGGGHFHQPGMGNKIPIWKVSNQLLPDRMFSDIPIWR